MTMGALKQWPLDPRATHTDPVNEPLAAGSEPTEIDDAPTRALADRQTDPVPETEREAQPVVAHQDRRHK